MPDKKTYVKILLNKKIVHKDNRYLKVFTLLFKQSFQHSRQKESFYINIM